MVVKGIKLGVYFSPIENEILEIEDITDDDIEEAGSKIVGCLRLSFSDNIVGFFKANDLKMRLESAGYVYLSKL